MARADSRRDTRMSHVLYGLGLRVRWQRLVDRHDHHFPLGLLAFANGVVSLGLLGLLAHFTHKPFVFPSLGPTAFLLFYRPHAPAASPRNAVFGHLIGVASAYLALLTFGLAGKGATLGHGVSAPRVGAAALSMGLTAALMVWFGAEHPPAAATTLIVSLGLLHSATALGILVIGVFVLVAQGLAVNRAAGVDYPLWHPHAGVADRPRPRRLRRPSPSAPGGRRPRHAPPAPPARGAADTRVPPTSPS